MNSSDISEFEKKLGYFINAVYRYSAYKGQMFVSECENLLDKYNLHTVRCSNNGPIYFVLKNAISDFYKAKGDVMNWGMFPKIELVKFVLGFAKDNNLSVDSVDEVILNSLILE